MSHPTLYDDDILLWSEQQAELIRNLVSTRRDLPNDFDAENVAEEIESVGRSELAAVESQLQNILVHLMKLVVEPSADAARHWRVEIVAFHGEARRRYAPSMRQRIDLDELWALAREISVLASDRPDEVAEILPERSQLQLADLLTSKLDSSALVRTIQEAGSIPPAS